MSHEHQSSGVDNVFIFLEFNEIICHQAVFERLLMEDPGSCVVSTRAVKAQPRDASMAGESEVLRYLYMCYERLQNISSNKQVCKCCFCNFSIEACSWQQCS